MKQTNDKNLRPKLRLSEIERLIREHKILVPPPKRRTLQNLCEDGTFETAENPPGKFGWLVYEDSFWRWAKSLDGEKSAAD
ncbi:MAG: hypothetical protein ACK42A_09405 [Pyrinomonadaceae bacterium]|jgi:hypothetical protein